MMLSMQIKPRCRRKMSSHTKSIWKPNLTQLSDVLRLRWREQNKRSDRITKQAIHIARKNFCEELETARSE